ncbi:TMEM175 family protein [Castellaniella sp.]|uniref:TMEM175 family protein n=1 Tax=Castellaniella sp. TaxID=1955812 RepID=UPI002B0026AD|nr:TMEM175 family protein [Castellaniella sp.]
MNSHRMDSARLEAFSDGVMAVALTIMVLELKPPHAPEWQVLMAQWPVALYGFVLLMAAGGFFLLQHEIVLFNGRDSVLAKAVGRDTKGKITAALYLAALLVVSWWPYLSCFLYAVVAAIWFIPDRRFEREVMR